MSISCDVCYECGSEIPEGDGQSVRACLGMLPGNVPHWGWVEVCSGCTQRSARNRRLWLTIAFVVVTVLTGALAYPLLP